MAGMEGCTSGGGCAADLVMVEAVDVGGSIIAGVQYKIIAKILANRLAKVADRFTSHEQSAFISGLHLALKEAAQSGLLRGDKVVTSDDIVDMARATRAWRSRVLRVLLALREWNLMITFSLDVIWLLNIGEPRRILKIACMVLTRQLIGCDEIRRKGGRQGFSREQFDGNYCSQSWYKSLAMILTRANKEDNGDLIIFSLDSSEYMAIHKFCIWAYGFIKGRNKEALVSMVAEIGNVSLSYQPDSWH
ncbi:hypothetical protein Tco_0173557 [Tanacetum coccineum]